MTKEKPPSQPPVEYNQVHSNVEIDKTLGARADRSLNPKSQVAFEGHLWHVWDIDTAQNPPMVSLTRTEGQTVYTAHLKQDKILPEHIFPKD